jgi:CheY-like chemotaxis protein
MKITGLPAHPRPERIMAFPLNQEKDWPGPAYQEPCIVLYVEDNADNLALVEQIFTRHPGLTFLAATNGPAGILLAREHRPHVILMDINMPSMSGLAVLEVLLGDPKTAHIPVVALSSDAFPKQIEKGIEAGFFAYMTKPFLIDELKATVAAAIVHSATHKLSQNSA